MIIAYFCHMKATKYLFILLLLLPLFALSQGLTKADLVYLNQYGAPIDCPKEHNFKFTYIKKRMSDKELDFTSICKFVYTYSSHIDDLRKFWPVPNVHLGLYIKIIDGDSGYYNAFFHNNLHSEETLPGMGLVINPKLSNHIDLQKKIWTHEYGHFVFDYQIRNSLNEVIPFESEVRNSFKMYQEAVKNFGLEHQDQTEEIQKIKFQILSTKIDFKHQYYREHYHSEKYRGLEILEEAYHLQNKIKKQQQEIDHLIVELYEKQGHLDGIYYEDLSGADLMSNYNLHRNDRIWYRRYFYWSENSEISSLISEIHNKIYWKRKDERKLWENYFENRLYSDLNLKERIEAFPNLQREYTVAKVKYHEADGRLEHLESLLAYKYVKYSLNKNEKIPFDNSLSVYSSLNETFSDYFSVLFHKDKSTMSETLRDIFALVKEENSHNKTPDKISYRDFAPTDLPARPPRGRYEVLFNTRQYLGQNIVFNSIDATSALADFLNASKALIIKTWGKDRIWPYLHHTYSHTAEQIGNISTYKELQSWHLNNSYNASFPQAKWLHWDHLLNWCSFDFNACKNTIVTELEKHEEGIFQTELKIEKINELLIAILSSQK